MVTPLLVNMAVKAKGLANMRLLSIDAKVYFDHRDWTVGVSAFKWWMENVPFSHEVTVHLLAIKVLIRF